MRMDNREAQIALRNLCCALVATTILIALFGAFVMARADKPIDCSWRNQSGRSMSQLSAVNWHCAGSDYIATRQ
jgi:hypothetical protein